MTILEKLYLSVMHWLGAPGGEFLFGFHGGDGVVVLSVGWTVVLIALVITAAALRDRFYSLTLALGAVAIVALNVLDVHDMTSHLYAGEGQYDTGLLVYGLPSLVVVLVIALVIVWRALARERREELGN